MTTTLSLRERCLEPPSGSFLLLGPRGTGKSTWLRQRFPDAHWIDLLSEETFQKYLARPGLFALEVRAIPTDRRVVVDEIQRLPNLLNEVHRLIEEDRRVFVLCGSSARKLRRAGVNLLAGRLAQRFMHPFTPAELGAEFRVDIALQTGLLPVVWSSSDRIETLKAYTQLYLKEEIQAEALVRNLGGFARFLPVAALFHAQTLNVANIARDCGVARTTVHEYLSILEDTLLCFTVPAFEARLRVRQRRHPKLYWIDAGLVRSLKGHRGDLATEERGALFEGLVAQLLRAYRDYRSAFDEMSYWASAGSSHIEVDFVLRRGRESVAVEAKAGETFREEWCRGLRAIASLPGLRRRCVVFPEGPPVKTRDGIEGLALEAFAARLAAGRLFED